MSRKNIIPDWKLERYLLGELPADEIEAVRALESSDGGLRGRIEALKISNAEILEKYPPQQTAKRIRNLCADIEPAPSYAPTSVSRPIWPRIAIGALACAALLIALPVYIINHPAQELVTPQYEDRVKGTVPLSSSAIEVWRKEGDAARKLQHESIANAGDVIQLRYIVPEKCYGTLVSLDGRGVLTVHLSGDQNKAAPLTPGSPVALENSYELDDAPYYEIFYLITAPEAFDVDDVARSLKNIDHPLNGDIKLSVPSPKNVTAFTLRKSNGAEVNEI